MLGSPAFCHVVTYIHTYAHAFVYIGQRNNCPIAPCLPVPSCIAHPTIIIIQRHIHIRIHHHIIIHHCVIWAAQLQRCSAKGSERRVAWPPPLRPIQKQSAPIRLANCRRNSRIRNSNIHSMHPHHHRRWQQTINQSIKHMPRAIITTKLTISIRWSINLKWTINKKQKKKQKQKLTKSFAKVVEMQT